MLIPKISALYESSLSSALSAAGTSFSVVSGTDRDGNALSGLYGFIIDEGSADEEFVLGTISGTTVTITYRGLDADGANTEISNNKKAHRRGASVKITDYPILGILRSILNGDETIPNVLTYADGVTPVDSYDLVTKAYVDALAILQSGVPDANTTSKGTVEEATQDEVDARTTTGGTGAKLFPPLDKIRASQYHDYAVDAVGTDAYAITITPAITAYAAGQVFIFKAGTANTGACTLNVSGLGAKDIKKNYNEALVTGDILANQIVVVVYDGTNMQVVSKLPTPVPTVQVLTANTPFGDSTTQFDITNPAGTTFRYTYDGTGTDPSISLATVPIGTYLDIQAQNFSTVNKGLFVTTGAGSNYFEVTNASGLAETNKTIGTGYINKGGAYTPPPNLRYAIVEVQGPGAGGDSSTSATSPGGGGGAGGYAKKLMSRADLGSTVNYIVGKKSATGTDVPNAGRSVFNTTIIANGGAGGTNGTGNNGGAGGSATGGDYNITGATGEDGLHHLRSSDASSGGKGGRGVIAGHGGNGGGSTGQSGSDGTDGLIVIYEHY